jgi:hypothetical protein
MHIIAYPPIFKLERELGRKWLSIGMFASICNLIINILIM